MHSTIQENPAQRRNPFEHYPKSVSAPGYSRARTAVMSAGRVSGQVNPASKPASVAIPRPVRQEDVLLSSPDARSRALRRQQYMKMRRFPLRFSLKTGLGRAIKLLGVALLVFILLPSSVQKRAFHVMPFRQEKPVVNQPPLPVDYDYISSPFGHRWGRQHQGIDFAAAVGEPIYATSAGTVIHSGWEPGYGKSVVIDHGHGVQTRYAHCSRLLAKEGAQVPKGGMIARVGSTGHSTGPHLHFEIIVDGVRKNPAWYFSFNHHQASHLASATQRDSGKNAAED